MVAGLVFYYTIRTIVYRQVDSSLITEKTIIQDQIEETDTIPDFAASFGHQIEVKLLRSPSESLQIIKDTTIFDARSGSYLPFRHLHCSGSTPRNTGYMINIYQTLDENQELLDSIALGMLILLLILMLVSIVVNYLVSKKIWRPFYNSLKKATNFDVLSDKSLELPETNIDEFRQLNTVFERMTGKMRKDYLSLKEYNENSSHEMQTPLAVIRSKLDLLMQNKGLNKESIELIRSVNEATARISKLNKGLLLISKIDNQQFQETREVSLQHLIETCLDNYEEILKLKKIRVETEFSDTGLVIMNEILADVLISNLLSNAVRYNVDGGFIKCHLDKDSLVIANSGLPLRISPERLFDRFQKGTDHPEALGLGLSIVKKITDYYQMPINYSCDGAIHEISLSFKPGQ